MNRPVMKKLTEQQRSDWAINGYICVEQALSAEEVDFFSDQIDEMRAKVLSNAGRARHGAPGQTPHPLVGEFGQVIGAKDLAPAHVASVLGLVPAEIAKVEAPLEIDQSLHRPRL